MRLITLVAILVYVCNGSDVWRGVLQQSDECAEKPADLVFVLDGSSSIWNPDFKKQLQFVSDIVDSFTIGDQYLHLGVLTFATSVNVELTLGQYGNNKDLIKKTILNIDQPRGETHTDQALRIMTTSMFSDVYSRPGIPHIGIVITDGASADTERTAQEANRAKQQGITLFAIGVGRNLVEEGVQQELNNIASGPDYVYTVESYGLLDRLKQDLTNKTCYATTMPPSTTMTTTTTTVVTTTTTTTAPPQMIEGCDGQQPMDVLFAIPDDAGIEDTDLALSFVEDVVDGLEIGPKKVQVGLTPRLCQQLDGIRLDVHDDKVSLQAALAGRGLISTDLSAQIEYILREGFTGKHGGRRHSKKTAIMVVDNVCEDPDQAQLLAEEARTEGITVLVIGVGPYANRQQLEAIASSPEHLYYVTSYKDLETLPGLIHDRLCRDVEPPVRPPQMIDGCEGHHPMDVILAAPDESGIRETEIAISFLQNITQSFRIGNGRVQVGMTPRFCIDLDGIQLIEHDDKDALKSSISQRHLSSTLLTNQLRYLYEQGFGGEDVRNNARRFALLMVDNALATPTRAFNLASKLKGEGVILMVVGIGPYAEETDLRRIASSDANLFLVDSYERLGAIQASVLDAFCRGI